LLIGSNNGHDNHNHQPSKDTVEIPLYRSGNMMLLSSSPSMSSEKVENDDDDDTTDTKEVFVDLYENLPETDEPTDCSVCRTYRQGPCRTPWRKFDYCTKDHEDDSKESVQKCSPYLLDHMACVGEYSTLYQLISLDGKQEYITDMIQSTETSERRCWPCSESNPNIVQLDWGKWPDFVAEYGLKYTQVVTGPYNNENKEEQQPSSLWKLFSDGLRYVCVAAGYSNIQVEEQQQPLPLWKRFPDGLNPITIEATVSIPRTPASTNDDKNFILRDVWVADQDGMLLGFDRSTQYRDVMDQIYQQKNPDADDDEVHSTDKEEVVYDEKVTCTFHIIPGCTKEVTIYGVYSENPLLALPSKEMLDVLLYSSSPYSVEQAAKECNNITTTSTST
jgi:hypothetical protein